LHKCGYTKKKMNNAICGVYIGCHSSDWGMVEKSCVSAACATGSAASITCGRVGLVFGF
jgi:acyl transferase domain-containing protein